MKQEKDGIAQESRAKNEIIRKRNEEISTLKKKLAKSHKETDILQGQKVDVERQRDYFRHEISSFSKESNARKDQLTRTTKLSLKSKANLSGLVLLSICQKRKITCMWN